MEEQKETTVAEYLRGILSEIFGTKLKYMDEDIYPDTIIMETINNYNKQYPDPNINVEPYDSIRYYEGMRFSLIMDEFDKQIQSRVTIIQSRYNQNFMNSVTEIINNNRLRHSV